MKILVPLGDCITTRRYPVDLWRLYYTRKDGGLYGDCITTRGYPGDYMEIVVLLGGILGIIWRL